MAADEVAQQIRQAGACKILSGAEPDFSADLRPRKVVTGAGIGLEDRTRKAGHRLAVGGEHHRMGVAHEQAAAGGGLELANVLAHRRLLQAEAAAGLGEVLRLRHGQEGFELGGVEHMPAIRHYIT